MLSKVVAVEYVIVEVLAAALLLGAALRIAVPRRQARALALRPLRVEAEGSPRRDPRDLR